ncbi:MAG: hypothetical protein HAW61_03250 [Candidatus Portiera sp.]|nr:hypothetical protein [Portiera sp.]
MVNNKVRRKTNWKPYNEGEKHDKSMWDSPKDGPQVLYKQLPIVLQVLKQHHNKNKHTIFKEINKKFEAEGASSPRLSDSRIGTIIALGRKLGLIKKENFELTNAGITSISADYLSIIQQQYIKLVFDNPILKNSNDIEIFPIIALMEILIETNDLSIEEVAIFIFSELKNREQIPETIKNISKFRKLDKESREELINDFKHTHKGNITLTKASSVTYLFSNLSRISLFYVYDKRIKLSSTDEAKKIIEKYKNKSHFKFKDHELLYWDAYYGNTAIHFPPKEVTFKFADNNFEAYLLIKNDIYKTDLIKVEDEITIPVFDELTNILEVYNLQYENQQYVKKFKPYEIKSVELLALEFSSQYPIADLLEYYKGSEIYPVLSRMLRYKERNVNSNLRGGRFENLVYEFLKEGLTSMKVNWNGRIDKDGIAKPATGGQSDIVVESNEYFYVVETTTMKHRSGIESAETFSLSRHAKEFLDKGKKVKIVLIAPVKYQSITNDMERMVSNLGIEYQSIDIDELISSHGKIFI